MKSQFNEFILTNFSLFKTYFIIFDLLIFTLIIRVYRLGCQFTV